MPSHTGHKQLRRVAWNQVGNEKVDGNCSPERNKIKTNSTEQITHAYPLPKVRPQGSSLQHTPGAAPPAVYCRGGACPRPVTLAGFPPALATLAGFPPALATLAE